MAVMDHGQDLEHAPVEHTPVDEALVREHAANWHAFTRFMTVGIAAVTVVLVLMAIFLL